MISAISYYDNIIPTDTDPSWTGYDDYTGTLPGINVKGLRGSVGFATLNSLFDNVSALDGFNKLKLGDRGVVNNGGHAFALTDTYLDSDGKIRMKIVDEQNPQFTGTYTEQEFYSSFESPQAVYVVGVQDWYNQAESHSYSPTEYVPITTVAYDYDVTTPYDNVTSSY